MSSHRTAKRSQQKILPIVLFAILALFSLQNCATRTFSSVADSKDEASTRPLRVAFVAAENGGIFKRGGLGLVVQQLPPYLRDQGAEVDILMPFYSNVPADVKQNASAVAPHGRGSSRSGSTLEYHVPLSTLGHSKLPPKRQRNTRASDTSVPAKFQVYSYATPKEGNSVLLFKHVNGLRKDGEFGVFNNIREGSGAKIYSTNHENELPELIAPKMAEQSYLFLGFSKAVARYLAESDYDIVHLHDWHTGTVPWAYKNYLQMAFDDQQLRSQLSMANVDKKWIMTVHNAQYQGVYPDHFPVDPLEQDHRPSAILGMDPESKAYKKAIRTYPVSEHNRDKPVDRFNMLKLGLLTSDAITTVSETYLKEITSPEGANAGGYLQEVFAERVENGFGVGIQNGIAAVQWNPADPSAWAQSAPEKDAGVRMVFPEAGSNQEPFLFGQPQEGSQRDYSGKDCRLANGSFDPNPQADCGKKRMQKLLGVEVNPQIPVFVLTSRMADQKGWAYIPEALDRFFDRIAEVNESKASVGNDSKLKAQIVLFNTVPRVSFSPDSDEPVPGTIGKAIFDLVAKHKKSGMLAITGFNKTPSNKEWNIRESFPEGESWNQGEYVVTAYSDFFVNVSYFEPSGLNQFFSMATGTIPILSKVGGHVDSITEGESGFFVTIPFRKAQGSQILMEPDARGAAKNLSDVLWKALMLYEQDKDQLAQGGQNSKMIELRNNAMDQDFSWPRQAGKYMKLYRGLIKKEKPGNISLK